MLDLWDMEHRALSALDPLSERERQVAAFLAEEAGGHQEQRPIRRRVGALIVGLGLKLDPDALRLRSQPPALEAASVRN
jgi:hypothetical protein